MRQPFRKPARCPRDSPSLFLATMVSARASCSSGAPTGVRAFGQGLAFGLFSIGMEMRPGASPSSTSLLRSASRRGAVAGAAMEAVGQLTGRASAHDFNILLTVIIGNLVMLEPKLTPSFTIQFASEAREAAEMGARLTDRC